MTPAQPTTTNRLDQDGRKRLVLVTIYLLFMWSLPFLAAGTLSWPAAWLYVSTSVVIFVGMGWLILRRNPGLINERGRRAKNTRPWDKAFGVVFLLGIVLTPVLSGLDFRWAWSAVPLWLQVGAYLLFIPATILPFSTMLVNDFLTTTVQVQTERGHQVVSRGPYRFVRHPMYSGAILTYLCLPLVLGSWWGLLPGLLTAVALIVRTALEDKTLQAELPGYHDYAQQVRYRLCPAVW